MSLIGLFTIKDGIVTNIPLRSITLQELCSNNDYVIEKYFYNPNPGGSTRGWNIDYIFKIFKDNIQYDFIDVGNWKIVDIRSTLQFNPSLLFVLEDPAGSRTNDLTLPYKWISRPGLRWPISVAPNLDGLKVMVGIAKEASAYPCLSSFVGSNIK